MASQKARLIIGFLVMAATLASADSSLITNARSGRFNQDQRFWFSVADDERLRLIVNDQEHYYGRGPASLDLSAADGERLVFTICVECLAAPPLSNPLELRCFEVIIDRQPPAAPLVSAVASADGAWILSLAAADDDRLAIVYDADGAIHELRDCARRLRIEAHRVAGFAWSVDSAGNLSSLTPFSYEPFGLTIINPVPGIWANQQTLVLEAEGAAELFWTADDSDPLEAGGITYLGPCRINKSGPVKIKIAARSLDGRVKRAEVEYIAGHRDLPAWAVWQELELTGVNQSTNLTIPQGYYWDPQNSAKSIELRVTPGIRRHLVLELSGTDRCRFLLTLEGSQAVLAAKTDYGVFSTTMIAEGQLFLSSVAQVRLITAPSNAGYRYLDETTQWRSFNEPVSIVSDGARLHYLVESVPQAPIQEVVLASLHQKPGFVDFPSLQINDELVSAGPVRLTGGPNGSRFYLSAQPLAESEWFDGAESKAKLELAANESLVIDVCDGEELRWTITDIGGRTSLSWIIDRRPPGLAQLTGPDDGAWLSNEATIALTSSEGQLDGQLIRQGPDGLEESRPLSALMVLSGASNGPVTYRLEAWVVDEAGNRGPSSLRSFTVDTATVYVSVPSEAYQNQDFIADGSRRWPFPDLNSALELAAASGRKRLLIKESGYLDRPAIVPSGLAIIGTVDSDWREVSGSASISLGPEASFLINGSAYFKNLQFKDIAGRSRALFELESAELDLDSIEIITEQKSGPSLISLDQSRLTASGCSLFTGLQAIRAKAAEVKLNECYLAIQASGRITAISLNETACHLETSRIEVTGDNVIAMDARSGRLLLNQVVIQAQATDSATALLAQDLSLAAQELSLLATAGQYATAAVLTSVSGRYSEGSLSASGRDVVAATVNGDKPLQFEGLAVAVQAERIGRGLYAPDQMPSLRACSFTFSGRAIGSEALAGREPTAGSISDCSFTGFDYLFGQSFKVEDLKSFNQRFALPGWANRS